MDINATGQFIKEIGTPLASLVILAVFAWYAMERMQKIIDSILKMFDEHRNALQEVKGSMAANTDATRELTFFVKNLNNKQ